MGKNPGSATLKRKGKATLESKQTFALMGTNDRSYQKKRDAWVKTKLAALIKAKQTDEPEDKAKKKKTKTKTVIIRIEEKDKDDAEKLMTD